MSSGITPVAIRSLTAAFATSDAEAPPTPENLAQVIRGLLVECLPTGLLDRIRLEQDADLWVEIVEPAAP